MKIHFSEQMNLQDLPDSLLEEVKEIIRNDPKYWIPEKFRDGVFIIVTDDTPTSQRFLASPEYTECLALARDCGWEVKEFISGVDDPQILKQEYHSRCIGICTRESWNRNEELDGMTFYISHYGYISVKLKLLTFLTKNVLTESSVINSD